jgi:hypothetical protein
MRAFIEEIKQSAGRDAKLPEKKGATIVAFIMVK